MDRSWPDAPDDYFPSDEATAYALAVRSGDIIAGPHVRNACARHLDDLLTGHERGIEFRTEIVEHRLRFFREVLRLAGGEFEDVPFDPLPWQCFVIGSLFGWIRTETKHRRFRTAYIETGKGSGKSPLVAGIGMIGLVADDEPRAEVYSAAAKKDQAMILFRDAVAMVDQSPMLSNRVTKSGKNPTWQLTDLSTASFFKPISSDSAQSGPRPHVAILDELHEHPDGEVANMMRAGTKGRRQALIVEITNSGFDRTSVCWEHHETSIRVAAGTFENDGWFSFVCGCDEDDDPITDEPDPVLGYPRSWCKANPSLQAPEGRRTFGPDYLRELVKEARSIPSKESTVRRLNFCEWVDAESPWISGETWRNCEVEEIEVEEGEPVYLGLDLSSNRDLTSLALVFPARDGLPMRARAFFWTPGDTVRDREREDRVPYTTWVRQGHLYAPDGQTINYAAVAKKIKAIGEEFEVKGVAADPWRLNELLEKLASVDCPAWLWEGPDSHHLDGLRVVKHGQGFGGGASKAKLWMPKSISDLESALLAGPGKLQVEENPVLRWNAASAVTAEDAQENKKWEKRKSRGRIDGIVALCQGVGMANHFEASTQSGGGFVETKGIRWV